ADELLEGVLVTFGGPNGKEPVLQARLHVGSWRGSPVPGHVTLPSLAGNGSWTGTPCLDTRTAAGVARQGKVRCANREVTARRITRHRARPSARGGGHRRKSRVPRNGRARPVSNPCRRESRRLTGRPS